MKNPPFKLHFVGIGGIGMSGLAEIFKKSGHEVSGSDLGKNEQTERLIKMGVTVYQGHESHYVPENCDAVVVSTAVASTNPECLRARELGVPIIPRAEMLAEVARGKFGIAIAGTHGKTTTTTMVAHLLLHAGLDPTVVVGGKVELMGSNARLGQSNIVVMEADESDGSFLRLPSTLSVITNIDLDHVDYFKSLAQLDDAFLAFSKMIPFYGKLIVCGDDPGVQRLLPHVTKPVLTYGFSSELNLRAKMQTPNSLHEQFEVWEGEKSQGVFHLSVLGEHNVLNALAAMAVARECGVGWSSIREAFKEFKHAKRRFDLRYFDQARNIRMIDDYGHHPTEIQAVIDSAKKLKAYAGHRRILICFQPHRYTRTEALFHEFAQAFQGIDRLVLLPIYAASEAPIEGVSSNALAQAIERQSQVSVDLALSLDEARAWFEKNKTEGDLLITLGAGSVTKVFDSFSHENGHET